MKSLLRLLSSGAALALCFTCALVAVAQEKPSAAGSPKPTEEKSPPESAVAPAAVEAPPPAAEEPASPPLRRLDTHEQNPPARTQAEEIRRHAEEMRQRARERADQDRAQAQERNKRRTGHPVVNVFADAFLPKTERADVVVAVFGNATSEGEVADSVVAVFGNNRTTGPVGDAVVAVFGNVTVNSHVRSVVAVFGNVELGPDAEVDANVVCVAGNVQRDPGAVVHNHVQNIGRHFGLGSGLETWLNECLFKGRPLAFNRDLGWAWTIALSFLAIYVFLALIFRGGIERCVQTLETRPGSSVLAAIVTVILSPVIIVLLCITVVGIFVVPFLAMGLMLASVFGNAVMLAWLGRRLTKFFGDGPLGHPAFAVLVGGALALFIYTVPVLGFLTYKLFGWLGLGVVVYTLLVGSRREKPVVPFVPTPVAAGVPPAMPGGVMAVDPRAGIPPVVSAVTLPRAGFWIRLAALALDGILIGVICAFLAGLLPRNSFVHFEPPHVLLVLAVYGALMWKFRGTTIGGVVCGLKVVRIDGREIDWATAIVRALGCFLSLIVAGLGFIWVAIDDDKQSWHDKIAGTTVVRAPKGVSLL